MRKVMTEIKESKEDELESQKAQEVIGLLLNKPDEECGEVLSFPTVCKSENDLPSSSITVSISDASPLNICQVSLTDAAGMILEPSDILRQSLDGTSSIQLEDGTTAFVQSFEPVDEADSGDATARFIDGQAVQLEDGSTAFIHAAPREGLQPVQLEDGTMAYLSQTGADLFNGEASTLDLEHISTSQLVDAEVKEMDLKVESFNKSTATKVAEKAFQCEYANCKRLYTTLHHLKVHERSHTGDRPFKCKSCTKSFATGYGLKSHTRVHTGETPYKCPDEACQKAFKTSGDLQKHVRTHTGERPFKCPFSGCDRAFTTSNIRKVHIRTHTGERPYTCKEEGCGRAFASATNYKNHIRIHTGEKPYLCAVSGCNKRFTEYSSLYKHHVVHTHFKPYACNLCGKNYRQTSTLAMHKRNAHGILEQTEEEEMTTESSSFPCSLCEKIFPQSSALITHKGNAHGILEQNDVEKMIAEPVNKTGESVELKKVSISSISKAKEQENNNKCANVQQDTKETSSLAKTTFPTIVALQGESSAQLLQEHSVYAVQLQEDGTLSSNMQQIVLVTDSQQLATLQQLAQHGQFETVLTATDGSLSSNPV